MSLTLHFHPLSSFCQKVLIGLYERDVPFEKHVVDLGNEAARGAFLKLWPMGKFPVIRDEARGRTVPESTIILEYLDERVPGKPRLVPSDAERAGECRLLDRFFDLHVHVPMQKIVTDNLRPDGQRDRFGVDQARAQIATAYGVADERLRGRTWAIGDEFTMADCAAAPALFFASQVVPFGDALPNLTAYFERLTQRPSVARTFEEARPYLHMVPRE